MAEKIHVFEYKDLMEIPNIMGVFKTRERAMQTAREAAANTLPHRQEDYGPVMVAEDEEDGQGPRIKILFRSCTECINYPTINLSM